MSQSRYTISVDETNGGHFLVISGGTEGTDRINLADVKFVGFNGGQTIVTTASLAGDDSTVTIPAAPVASRGLAGTNLTEGADSQGFSDAAEVIYGLGGNDGLVMAGGDNLCC